MAERIEGAELVHVCDSCGKGFKTRATLFPIILEGKPPQRLCTLCTRLLFKDKRYDLNKVPATKIRYAVRLILLQLNTPKYEENAEYMELVSKEPFKSLLAFIQACKV